MADPGRTPGAVASQVPPDRIGDLVPAHVAKLLRALWAHGHAAYLVGGSLRDLLLGRGAADWDVATDAVPERIQELFPGSHYENRFGTVIVATPVEPVEVTTFREDHAYVDHRRPEAVTFGASIGEDLRRRDFTINALAWGADAPGTRGASGVGATGQPIGRQAVERAWAAAGLVDLTGGLRDLAARVIRAVGDPELRFDEDALRLVRAARLASQLGFAIEPATLAAMRRGSAQVRHVSRERVGQELRKLLRSGGPSVGLRILAEADLLRWTLPELEAQRGLPQAKMPGLDCWEHTLWTVDAAAGIAPHDELLALAALLHDVGKPATLADGHFVDHQIVGAEIAGRVLRRLAVPHAEALRVTHLIRHHMFRYDSAWGDVAVRQFIRTVGPEALERLLLLREADNVGSGGPRDDGPLAELRARIARQLEARVPLTVADLAVDGEDLKRELDLEQGPLIGAILERLLHSVVSDPSRNTYRQCLIDARGWLPGMTTASAPKPGESG